jgi:hypothetical protein
MGPAKAQENRITVTNRQLAASASTSAGRVALDIFFFLLVLMRIFALHRYCRSLGLDTVIVVRSSARTTLGRILLDAAK